MKMKNKILALAFLICLIGFMQFASADLSLWTNVIVNNVTQIVRYHSYHQFEDTSASGIGKHKPIELIVYSQVEELPFNFTGSGGFGSVDYCNLTIHIDRNIWNDEGNIINTTTEEINYYYGTGLAVVDLIPLELYDRDSLLIDMDCHYTDARDVFFDSTLIGTYFIYTTAYQCVGCTDKSIEEITKETELNNELAQKEVIIYGKLQSIVSMNYKVWTIINWFIQIAFVILALGMAIYGVYWIYEYLEKLRRSI